LVSHLIRESGWHQVLVFTRTKHGANRLAEKLVKDGLSAAAIHGNKSQSARTRALAGFKDGSVAVLVATDIAARGLDIDQLPQVVNFELPNVPEDYVHRIGRTGRAGATGAAVSLVDSSEIKLLKAIERLIKKTIERKTVDGWTPPVGVAAEPEPQDDEERGFGRRNGRGVPGGRNGGNRGGGHRPGGEARAPRPARSAEGRPAAPKPAAPKPAATRPAAGAQPARRPESGNRPARGPARGVLLGK
ncbi:RNA helicase, partial [Bordetella hinzii]|nr:RNA helicase [Bordetella hinzii]